MKKRRLWWAILAGLLLGGCTADENKVKLERLPVITVKETFFISEMEGFTLNNDSTEIYYPVEENDTDHVVGYICVKKSGL